MAIFEQIEMKNGVGCRKCLLGCHYYFFQYCMHIQLYLHVVNTKFLKFLSRSHLMDPLFLLFPHLSLSLSLSSGFLS